MRTAIKSERVSGGILSNLHLMKWHRWFALWPVMTEDAGRVWLEWVWRKGIPLSWGLKPPLFFIYRDQYPDEEK